MSGSICSASEVDASRIAMPFIGASGSSARPQTARRQAVGHASTENFSNLHDRDRGLARSSDPPAVTLGHHLTYGVCLQRAARRNLGGPESLGYTGSRRTNRALTRNIEIRNVYD